MSKKSILNLAEKFGFVVEDGQIDWSNDYDKEFEALVNNLIASSSKMFEVEQQIMRCWEITEDLWLLACEHEHDDNVSNKVLGLKHVYEMRFNKLWSAYEDAYTHKS